MSIIKSSINPRSAEFQANAAALGKTVADLREQAARVSLGGGDAAHFRSIGLELGRAGIDAGFDDGHLGFLAQAVSENSSRPISMRRISEVPAPSS